MKIINRNVFKHFLIMTILFLLMLLSAFHVFAESAFRRELDNDDLNRERRIALVIGNSDYKSSPLRNPVNDVDDIAMKLNRLGFQVTKGKNMTRKEMRKVIRQFGNDLKKGGVGLFYYSGHGMQVKGKNYLIPVGVDIQLEDEVEDEAIDAGLVMRKMESAGNTMNMVFLDACRDNPFARSFRSASKGLAQMDAPSGSLIVYATAPGSVAEDGIGRNGTFSKNLLLHLNTPGLEIGHLLRKVRVSVEKETGGRQVPWESSSLKGSFYFVSNKNSTDTVDSQEHLTTSTYNPEEEMWALIKDSSNIDDIRLFLESFPGGNLATVARLRIKQLGREEVESETSRIPVTSDLQYGVDSEVDIELVYVKGGCYKMGDTFGDGFSNESLVHKVCVDSFFIGKYEVTHLQWENVMGWNPSKFKNCDNCPVENVSWNDIQEFINKLNQKTGKSYRLPTEAEWEYAARSGGEREKWSGVSSESSLSQYAWYKDNSRKNTHPIGKKSPNGVGIYDMTGNVCEWCQDIYGADSYKKHQLDNPIYLDRGSYRVVRGGSWFCKPKRMRTSSRDRHNQNHKSGDLGFRIAMTP